MPFGSSLAYGTVALGSMADTTEEGTDDALLLADSIALALATMEGGLLESGNDVIPLETALLAAEETGAEWEGRTDALLSAIEAPVPAGAATPRVARERAQQITWKSLVEIIMFLGAEFAT